jgi:hypothetical protein
MTAQNITSYGLHWDGAVAWLVQGRSTSNFSGLKATPPFRATGMCNHLIPTAAPIPDDVHWEKFLRIIHDPLVQAMLPLPNAAGSNAFFIEDPYDDLGLYLATLSRLSSPIRSIVKPGGAFKMKDLEQELSASNIQPLVVVQVDQKVQTVVDMVSQLAPHALRTVVLTGSEEVAVPPRIQRITTQIRKVDLAELITLPLENIGAAVMRRYARREKIDEPMESREQRRQRQIQERSGS